MRILRTIFVLTCILAAIGCRTQPKRGPTGGAELIDAAKGPPPARPPAYVETFKVEELD